MSFIHLKLFDVLLEVTKANHVQGNNYSVAVQTHRLYSCTHWVYKLRWFYVYPVYVAICRNVTRDVKRDRDILRT